MPACLQIPTKHRVNLCQAGTTKIEPETHRQAPIPRLLRVRVLVRHASVGVEGQ